ncbi:Chorion class A protein Ld12 [Papilio machaon]|uniref:Chorion class A protein Ld12 n=1 Tax=Papilio machaon TaxID=76193 RepID=A0A194QZC9_PAPMA|nr:Chorion class A protein Ld12 [Papilio machaon]
MIFFNVIKSKISGIWTADAGRRVGHWREAVELNLRELQAINWQVTTQNALGECLEPALGLAVGLAPEMGLGYGPGLAEAYGPGLAPGLGYGYGFGPAPYGPGPYGPGPAYGPSYGGAGIGDVEIAGEMPVAGTTVVAGQVPILGAVQFGGDIPAGGVVTISGRCGCGCNGPYMY